MGEERRGEERGEERREREREEQAGQGREEGQTRRFRFSPLLFAPSHISFRYHRLFICGCAPFSVCLLR